MKDQIKQKSEVIERFLKDMGIDIPHGKALDLASRLVGCKDWNTLVATKTKPPNALVEELKSIAGCLPAICQALDDASSVVDPGENEERAYAEELENLKYVQKQVEGMVTARQVYDPHGLTLLVLPSIDGENWSQYVLVPGHLDPEVIAAQLEAQIGAWNEENEETDFADSYDWTDVEALAVKLGCIPVKAVASGPQWD